MLRPALRPHFRMRLATLAPLVGLTLVVTLGGCATNDSTTGPLGGLTQDDADDVAVQASMSLANFATIVTAGVGGSDGGPSGNAPRPLALSSHGPGFAVMADTTWTAGALTITLSRTWYSLTGEEQAQPGPTTDSVSVTSRIAGSDSTARWAVTVGHAGWAGVGGLNPLRDAWWLNGSQADTLSSRFTALHRPVTRWFDARTQTTVANVRWTKPLTSEPTYPSSGTATLVLAATAWRDGARVEVERTLAATIVVRFNGTRYPDVSINGSYRYTWDLETGTIVRAGAV